MIKKVLLMLMLLFVLAEAVVVKGGDTAPEETLVVNGDKYVIYSKVDGRDVDKDDTIIINGNTCFRLCNNESPFDTIMQFSDIIFIIGGIAVVGMWLYRAS